jgi:O-methyltransferase
MKFNLFFQKLSLNKYFKNKEEKLHLLIEEDVIFNSLYDSGMEISKTPDSGPKRRARFYNLISFLKGVESLPGVIIECGCWKGLSSYLICNYLKETKPSFNGENFFVIDSFEGLSEPNEKDIITSSLLDGAGNRKGTFFKKYGAYSSPIDTVKKTLSNFKEVTFFKGWIPKVLNDLPDLKVKFVHIDLDLYDPIFGSLEYFFPRLVKGGIIVCDDYGSLYWPGAKMAVDEFVKSHKLKAFPLSTGQIVLIKF